MDLIQICKDMQFSYSQQNNSTIIENIVIPDASFADDSLDYSAVLFRDCLFQRLEINTTGEDQLLPRLHECYIGILDGRVSKQDLPKQIFDKACIIDSFGDSSQNTAAILSLPLPTGARVLLTILKKLYLQPGAGRKESALFRGLDHRSRILVPEILQLLVREKLTFRSTVGGDSCLGCLCETNLYEYAECYRGQLAAEID